MHKSDVNQMGVYNLSNRNVSEFGGMPFTVHRGHKCHRGVKHNKKADFHPIDHQKHVIYRDDGSGRDGYITNNNGGNSISNVS